MRTPRPAQISTVGHFSLHISSAVGYPCHVEGKTKTREETGPRAPTLPTKQRGTVMGCPITPHVERLVDLAIEEDLGRGDATARAEVIGPVTARARILTKEACVVCGLDLAEYVMTRVDPGIQFDALVPDGEEVPANTPIAAIDGSARGILAAERTALNFLMHLSGIATLTRRYVRLVAATNAKARVVDTRKTTPAWRLLEKYAVATGGGLNHRMDLASGVLIKENHIAIAGSVRDAVTRAKKLATHTVRIEVEVQNLEELHEAIEAGADIVLLDNMTPDQISQAVAESGGKVILEASGGIDTTTVAKVAIAGVDYISIGRLTHSAPAADLSLLIEEAEVPEGAEA